MEIGIGADDIVEINEKSMSSTLENLARGGVTGSTKRPRRSISRAVKATLKPGMTEPSIWEADSTLFNTRQSSFEPVDPVTGEKLPSEAALERVLSESIYRRAEGAQKELLALYAFRPELRSAVTQAVDRVAEQRDRDSRGSTYASSSLDEEQLRRAHIPPSPWLQEAAEGCIHFYSYGTAASLHNLLGLRWRVVLLRCWPLRVS